MTTLESTREATQKFAPIPPEAHYAPQQVAPDTYLIRQIQGEGDPAGAVFMNSLVILGKEPVIVDTGTEANRRNWFGDVESLVDLRDVKWIFISHDDHDHTGNLVELLDRAPNATLITNWFQIERMSCSIGFPMDRMRWVNDGESFDVGDRTLLAIRPPVFDAPTTRGLYDPRTKVYWAVDTFAAPIVSVVEDARDIEEGMWREGFNAFASFVSPWHAYTDQRKFAKTVDRIASLDIEVAVGAHTPPVRGSRLQQSYDLLRNLPNVDPAVMPPHSVLEEMLAAIAPAAAA